MSLDPQLELTAPQLARFIRRMLPSLLHDETGGVTRGTAIYTLSDPRDARETRYVGQTRTPRRRLAQHLNAARLWMPDELPWWIAAPRHRPLYEWIRSLYRDDQRLPVMLIADWVDDAAAAHAAERALIQRCLHRGLPLLNIESSRLDPQLRLF